MAKLTLPKPEIVVLPGDPEEPVPQQEPTSNVIPSERFRTAGIRTQEWLKSGRYTRAVVVRRGMKADDRADAHNWGIVVMVHPDRPYGLEVQFVDGTHEWCMGPELEVIYPGMTQDDFNRMMVESYLT